ncbi:MAG: tetratricopeptide repeat protein [Blastocatellia bacterium]|nr:tetratricopeptide repeat protein [Blastocatellia bacterium]
MKLSGDAPDSAPLGQELNTTYLDSGEADGFSSDPSAMLGEKRTKKLDAASAELDPVTRPTAPADLPAGIAIQSGNEQPISASLPGHLPTEQLPAPAASSRGPGRGLAISLIIAVVLVAATTVSYFFFFKSASGSSPDSENAELSNANQSQLAAQAATIEQPPSQPGVLEPGALDPKTGLPAQPNSKSADETRNANRSADPNSGNSQPSSQGDGSGSASPPTAPSTEPAPPAAPKPTAEEYKNRGLKSLGAKQYDQALADFRAALSLQPSNPDLRYLTGMAYEGKGLLPEALNEYRKCLSGTYAPLARQHVKRLSKKLEKN